MASGLQAQIGYGEESTWGTRVAPTVFIPLISEDIAHDREPLVAEGIIAGHSIPSTDQINGGPVDVRGPIAHELYTSGIDILLKHMFGSQTNTGSGPYTHVYKPTTGTIDGKGLTVQVGRPGVGGTVHPHDVAGGKIESWEIACSAGEIATLGVDLVGKSMVVNQTLATAAYTAAGSKPFKFTHGAVSIGGSTVNVMEATVSGNNGLKTDRRFIDSAAAGTIAEPLEASRREYTGSFSGEFNDLTQYNRFVAGTEVALVLAFTAGAASLTIEGNIRFDGAGGRVGGSDILTEDLPFRFIRTTGGLAETAIKITTVNAVATV